MTSISRVGRPPLDENDETARITFRIPATMAQELKRQTERHGGPSEILRQLVAQYLRTADTARVTAGGANDHA